MKKLLIIPVFISLFFINCISAKAYWKIDAYYSTNEEECKEKGYIWDHLPAASGILVKAGFCYKYEKVTTNEIIDKCTVNLDYGPTDLLKRTEDHPEISGGCKSGYFKLNYSPDVLGYANYCYPCNEYKLIYGIKVKGQNGNTCLISSPTENACNSLGSGYSYIYEDGAEYCKNGSTKIRLLHIDSGFGDIFFNGDQSGKRVCEEGKIRINEYCYSCTMNNAPPTDIPSGCAAFKQITAPVWKAIRIIAPILAVVLGALDFLKATAASDEKEMRKATNNFVKRLIMLALLFLLTYIVNFIVGLVNGVDLGNIFECL